METHFTLNYTPAGLLSGNDVMSGTMIEDYVAKKVNVLNSPNGDFTDEGDRYCLRIVVAGLNRKDISIEVEGRIMKVSGRKNSHDAKNRAAFMRQFILPWDADATNVKAKCRDGILTIDIGKMGLKEKAPRSIPVKGANEKALSVVERVQRFVERSWSRVRSVLTH